ncbi:hypothetical protein LGT39_02865 [Demequina sp. TTPB684]|uniref:hypothetical protein n=1 Tax=unclassified Demequina TaxID=2620311 RepID=UPI001CF468C4|nr:MULTISPECIES: hypothetical protein [unclassified Demequina]MCB2411790.1 hypothetical protein [Demequina sp. TTPB684]UPU89019.1 hypothetical protein LGT36_003595 [Demequina sp. TMPB413]
MTFAVPAPKSVTDPDARFEFTMPGSKKKWAVPLLKYLPIEIAEKVVVAKQVRDWMPLFGPPEEPLALAIRGLTTDQVSELVKAWGEASGITVGESAASSNS